jgi:mannosyltransferase OCH1-like enzyme
MYALYTEGGIYLDSDVKILKPFDDFLDNSFFSSMEYHPTQVEKDGSAQYIDQDGHRIADKFISGIQIQAAVMGAEKGCPFVGEVLDWYQDKHFVRVDGSMATDVLSPYIYARIAEKHGFVYKDTDQQLDGRMRIYPSEIFAGNKHEVTPRSYAIHYCAHSWHPSVMEKLKKLLHR